MNTGLNEEATLAVKRGAYWLDENHPNWAEKIDLGLLKMSECELCIIGQAIRNYDRAMEELFPNDFPAQEDWAIYNGFQASGDFSYGELETVWSEEVYKRLG